MALDLLVPAWPDAANRHGFRAPTRLPEPGGSSHPLLARQVHGTALIDVRPDDSSPVGEADGLISAIPGLAIAVATADCAPILLDSPSDGVAAALHAGWRGTLAGIVTDGIRHLQERHGIEPKSLRAALGPSIDGCCFEIEREIAEGFANRFGSRIWALWQERPAGKGTLDLRGVNTLALLDAGLAATAIERVGPCTFCGGDPWASYRRLGPSCGRQLNWIAPAAKG